MKIGGHGQATILDKDVLQKIKDNLPTARDRILFSIAQYTGERWGAIVQLQVECVYADTKKSLPRSTILYPACIRKGKTDTREVPVHENLFRDLAAYQPPLSGWMFPSPRNTENHLSFDAADQMLRETLERAELSHLGISTHSTRRTFITALAENSFNAPTIQKITGHRSLASVQRYIEISSQTVQSAIASLA